MIVDVLLPSEIARLVYGYLLDEKCTETAKTFLNESPNLYECRSFLQCGRAIPSRVHGYALLNMLETFCSINSIVQDQLNSFDSTHKIRKCNDIVTQIKFLLEECRSQTVDSRNEPLQSVNAAFSGTPSKTYKKRHSGINENVSNIATQSDDGYQTETPPDSNSMHNIPSVEATPLEHLPGYIESLRNKKCETSQFMTVKTPTKTTNIFTQSQLVKENVISRVVPTSLKDAETHQVCQTSQTEKKVQSQEVQTSMREVDELLVPKLITNSIHKVQNDDHQKFEENVNRLNTGISVTHVQEKLSHFSEPKNVTPETNSCNNLRNCISNQGVNNLDDSGDQTSLESPKDIDPGIKVSEACIEILEDVQSELLNRTEMHEKIASNINKLMEHTQSQFTQGSESDGNDLFTNELDKIIGTAVDMTENDPMFIELLNSVVKLDDHVSSSEEVEMDIDNENPSSGENISNEDVIIVEETNQSSAEIINTDSMNITPVIESVLATEEPEMANEDTSSQNTVVLDSVCNETHLAKQSTATNNMPNNADLREKCSIDSMEPSLLDKNFPNPPEFPDHNTSTPLKLFTATQNYDTSEWFSTELLPSSNIVPMKEPTVVVINGNFPYTQTATENIVSPVDGFILPITSKENTKIAEKISLNCSAANSKEDDTLHTPDVPLVTKSIIATIPAAVTNVQPKNKTPVLTKNSNGENVPPNVQTSPSFISISSLVKNTEFNRYFSIDSITVSQLDSTANTVQNPSTLPEIQIEDSVEFTSTGLSPFLKIHKKTERNAESRINQNSGSTVDNNIEDTQTLNVKIDQTNIGASQVAMKNTLDARVNESICKMKSIQKVTSKPAINQSAHDIVAQSTAIEAKEVTIGETVNEMNTNKDVALTAQKIDINTEKNLDSTLKDASNKADNKTNSKVEDDIEQLLKTVVGETDEINECSKGNRVDMASNVHNQMDATTKNVPTSNQTVNVKHIEPKVQVGSSNKESLKSFICKTFEPYIEKNKDNIASNHNSEVPTRNTPKALVEERAKNQRRSLSTPKKSNSHIRALTFETPIQSQSDSKINDQTRCASPESAKRNLKRVHESFQSPPVVHCDLDNKVQDNEEASNDNVVNEKEKFVAEGTSGADGRLSQEKEIKENTKKSWDSDLRMLCQASEQSKVEVPKRKYKTKFKEESSAKKKKRDKSRTPRKEKKNPHNKKSKNSEKEKTTKKLRKHNGSSEHKEQKNKDGKDTKTKAESKLSAKDCKDLGAQIESNLLSNNETVNKDEIKKKDGDKLSMKECKDIGAQIESNFLSNKSDKVISKVEIKSTADEKSSAKENKDISTKIENNSMENLNKNVENNDKANMRSNENKILPNNQNIVANDDCKKVNDNKETKLLPNKGDEKSTKQETYLNGSTNKKEDISNANSNDNQRIITDLTKTEVVTNLQEIPTQDESKEFPPIIPETTKKKDPLEYLLSDSVNDDEAFNDMMEMDSTGITYHEELTKVKKPIDKEIMEKMVQDEQAIATVLEEANHVINEKYKSNDVIMQQDFFPETSLMTDGDESEEESGMQEDIVSLKEDTNTAGVKIVETNNLQSEKEKTNLQNNEGQTKVKQPIDKPPDTSAKPIVDYDSIEKQLSILTNTEVPSARKVIYDQVNKLEDGKVVSKKYARLKTINTKLVMGNKLTPLGGYEIVLDSSSSVKGDESMEMPPTPQIVDPGSNSWVPNPLVKEDSRTIHSSIPTPLECPPTPKIFITPQKVEEGTVTHVVPQKAKTVPFYHLTPITFEVTKKPEVTEFEVIKEVLKKTTPKTPSEKKEENKTNAKTPKSVDSSYRDESSSRLGSEDSDSSSSSDSSDSSSSSSEDVDDSSMQAPVLAKMKEDTVEDQWEPEKKPQLLIHNEEVVAGNEIIFIEHEEVVMAQESSPTKVFSIHKTDKELEETVKETPAKDENMIPEEGIFETPNISKPVENPMNLHAKISEMMILKEQEENRRLEAQQKPKIIDNVRLSPKVHMKHYMPQVKAMSATNKQVNTMIVEKSEAEVAKAIESIANEKFDDSQDELNINNTSTIPPVQPSDILKKRELTKAIQSIIKNNENEGISELSSDDDSSSDGEPNLELVLEDVKFPHQGLSAEVLTDESLGFENSESQNTEFHIVFDEANYKKKRRTEFFTDDTMTFTPADEDGNVFATIAPTCVDILFNLIPPKKKKAPKKKIKEGIKEEEEEEFNDGDSSEDFAPAKNTRGGTKRKILADEPKSRKRKKNIFIY